MFHISFSFYKPSFSSYLRSPFLDLRNSRFVTFSPRFDSLDIPLLSFSGSVSFDALCNQVMDGARSYNSTFLIFSNFLFLMDTSLSILDTFFFDLRLIFQPSIDTSTSPASISGLVKFQILLDAGGVKKNEFVTFTLKNSGSCVSDSEFHGATSDSFVSKKMKDLNFFQVLSKITVFYKVFSQCTVIVSGPLTFKQKSQACR